MVGLYLSINLLSIIIIMIAAKIPINTTKNQDNNLLYIKDSTIEPILFIITTNKFPGNKYVIASIKKANDQPDVIFRLIYVLNATIYVTPNNAK